MISIFSIAFSFNLKTINNSEVKTKATKRAVIHDAVILKILFPIKSAILLNQRY